MLKLFITGTDTDVGKTYVSVGLLNAFNRLGYSTLGIKPVASGCFQKQNKLHSHDALALQQASTIKLCYEQINPFAFKPPIAPNIAAHKEERALNVALLNQKTQYAREYAANICLIEGVGGWHVPLNEHETMADFVSSNQFKVILVTGIHLGCINHSILTLKAIQQDNIHAVGWIANCLENKIAYRYEIISTLQKWLPIPYLGCINYQCKPIVFDRVIKRLWF